MLHLASMESKISETQEIMLSRGFWDYGTEGSMRKYAHALADQGVIPIETILLMRKHEKDYQLRYDQKYFDYLEATAYNLIEDNQYHDSVNVLIMSYQHAFERMVELDQDLGLGRKNGVTSEIRNSFLVIHRESEAMLDEYNQEREELYSQLVYIWFLAIGGIIGVSIFMSTFLSGRLASDIKGLTHRLHAYVANGFQDEATKEQKTQSVLEVRELEENFDAMKRKLEKLLADLRRERQIAEEAAETKSRFLANMSHEIRTPLNGVIGVSQLMTNTPLNNQQQEYLDIIQFSGNNLLGIINDILDYSKIDAGKMELEQKPISIHHTI
ncbi:MAG: hypothetical protein HRT74_12205, partial [Flavobacteriales bacterium]|nr:hypothetical protein [Flavobacteriales bacterium]